MSRRLGAALAAVGVVASVLGAAQAQIPVLSKPASAPPAASAAADSPQNWVGGEGLRCTSSAVQAGAVLCRTPPGAVVELDGKPIARADQDGLAVVGLPRSQKSPARLSTPAAADGGAAPPPVAVVVQTRHDPVSKLEMTCGKIKPQSPEDKKRAEESWIKKDKALKIFNPPQGALGLAMPVDGVYSSSYGATRTYVPTTKECEPTTSVHNGTDIAVPTGTEIRAPMAGAVILAEPDLFFEGGCVFLDLGRGLVSVTMHMSRLDVKAGDRVKQGQLLGLSGATGRATGPHVHWAIKYRNVFDADRGSDVWLDPMAMLKLAPQTSAGK